jgi:murein L,D-transpeptidase YcbB/YkuD
MERRRWLARALPPTRIDVNIASAELVYLRDGNEAWTSRAVAGSPEDPTPPIGGAFKQLVVNPPWNVPEGIAAEEILPKGPAYMAANDMYVDNGRVVQRPGPKAALGAVKFDMQNRWAIYLHDTPAKSVFASDQRHRSHGCVRVERAVEFARFLANERGVVSDFDTDLQSGETGTVQLKEEVPVRLLYHTAYVDKSGRLIFADDVYEWDDRLGQAMGLEPSRRRPTARMSALLGP